MGTRIVTTLNGKGNNKREAAARVSNGKCCGTMESEERKPQPLFDCLDEKEVTGDQRVIKK